MSQKKIDAITDMNKDFPQWYTDVVKKAELVEYSPVRGCLIFRPYGYRIWELIQSTLDTMFKQNGVENVYMPLFIPQSLFNKEKDHIKGFAPEAAIVTHGGDEELSEPLIVRPTSETMFCDHFSNIIQSYRDLPLIYNQWANVVRWEKTTRPFLRTMEFLWQEGHTAHATNEEAEQRAKQMLEVYATLFEDIFAVPVIRGRKSENEKFAGAMTTYTIESLMHDGKALQSGTSHNLGNVFAKAFDITFTDENNKLQHVYQTSWGTTTRMIGSIIMVHGDNNGLVLPPKIAPYQLVIIPIAQQKQGVLQGAQQLYETLAKYFRAKIDISDKSPGWKFSEYEMKGIPIRVEIGPKDIEIGQAVLVRRDNGQKIEVNLNNIVQEVSDLLDKIHISMFNKATKMLNDKTYIATDMQQFEQIINLTPGFIKAMWCGDGNCEDIVKQKTTATIRCVPNNQEVLSNTCVCCDKQANQMVYFAKAY